MLCNQLFYLLATALLVWGGSSIAGPEPIPVEVRQAAQAGLARFLNQIPAAVLQKQGVLSANTDEKLTLSRPFRMQTVGADALENYSAGDALSRILSYTQYISLVMADGSARALLIVDKVGGKWKGVSLGHAELAAELDQIRRDWPEHQGFNVKFAVSPQARQHFFTVPELGPDNLTPVQRRPKAQKNRTKHDYKILKRLSKLAPELKQRVRKNRKQHPRRRNE